MLRKHNYIIPKIANSGIFLSQIIQQFKFKIFKYSTRYKTLQLKYTIFTRKRVVIWRRRSD
jgi:membrane protein YdbS with pleckstrin-like domain